MNKKNRNCIFFYLILLAAFIGMFVFNALTPYMSDDFCYDPGRWKGISEAFDRAWENYLTWNGRIIPQILMNFALAIPKWLFNIINSLFFVGLVVLIYLNARDSDLNFTNDYKLLLFIIVLLFLFGVAPGQTMLWVAGSCNYLWATVISFAFLTTVRCLLIRTVIVKGIKRLALCFSLFVFGVLAGWCNENTSGGILILVLFSITYDVCKKSREEKIVDCIKVIPIWIYSGIVGICLGLFGLVASPGGRVRMEQNILDENQSGVFAYFGRFLKLNDYVKDDFSVLIIMVIVLLCLSFAKNKVDYYSCAIVVSAILTIYVLVLTPTPMDRAIYGAGVMLIMATARLGYNILNEDIVWEKVIKHSTIIILLILFIYTYFADGANLMRINRELEERDLFAEEQINAGCDDLVLPMIRQEWDNKYTFIYLNDIEVDDSGWGNYLYRTKYGVHDVVGIPREEWDSDY